MSGTLRDPQALSHRPCLLPSVAHTPSVTQVTPAKKITFLKRGDPRFAGVRLPVHQRAFKSFSALMDELSQRVPLSFGVRSVTTPRGLHGLSALEQLQDGHCYLCSDRMPPKTPTGPGRPQGRSPSVLQSQDSEGGHEASGQSSSLKGPKGPRKITLVKNRDPRFQENVVLSHRNTRNLAAFLTKASDLLHFPVKQLYTTSGTKVDSLQALLRSPSVLVCAGHEAFRPPAMENAQRNRTKALCGSTSRNKNSCWGPKAKQSVIHSRSRPSSRPQQALPLERSGLSDAPASLHGAWVGLAPDRHPQGTPALPGPLVAGDDMEKKVHMNEDGSLSVEMKVRFQLLSEDTLRWSQRVGRARVLAGANAEGLGLGEVDTLCCRWGDHPWGFSEPGAQRPGPCEAGCQGALGGASQQPGPSYEIWRNPLYFPQGAGPAPQRSVGLAQLSHCRGRCNQGDKDRERQSEDSVSPASSAGRPDGSEPESCSPRTPGGSGGSESLSPASTAASQCRAEQEVGEGLCPEGARLGGQGQLGCPRSRSGSSASVRPHQESSEQGGQHQDCLSQASAVTFRGKAIQGRSPGAPTPSPSSLSNRDLQAEMRGQGIRCCQARGGPVMGLSPALGHSGSWDPEGGSSPLPICVSAQRGRRKQHSPARAVPSPSVPGLSCKAQRHARQCHHCRDTHCPLDSPAAPQAPRPLDRGRACPGGPASRFSQNASRAREQASGNLTPSSPGSVDSQDLPAATNATVTPVSNSDSAPGLCHPSTRSAGLEGATECRAGSPAATPTHTQGAGGQGDQAGGTPRLSAPLALPTGWSEGGEAGAHPGCCCSQTGESPILGTPSGQAQAPWGPFSEACRVCSRYCPTPPGGRPCTKKQTSSSSSSSGGHQRADDGGSAGVRLGEERLEVECKLSPCPKPGTVGRTGSPRPGAGPRRVLLGKPPGDGEGPEGRMPGALPSTSPDAVVREWLDNIPEEPLLVRDEMVDELTHGTTGEGPAGPSEDPGEEPALPSLGELAQARQQPLRGDIEEHPEPNRALPGTGDVGSKPGVGPHQGAAPDGVSKAPVPAGVGEGAPGGHGVSLHVLPRRVSTSTQIMKALMGSKQGRPSSLPEVSGAEARRLSHSAGALLACLEGLHFFDEDLGSPTSKVRLADSPGYQELLSISQTLWPGCGLGRGQLDSSLGERTSAQALPVTENFTPTSSSGVDVNSGSGGSGEGSVPCAVDCALVPERMELPPRVTQRPNSRASGHLEDLGTPQLSCPAASSSSQAWAYATSRGNEERGSREQMLGDNLGQLVENAMQEGGVQLEATEEIESQRPQEEGVEEAALPEDPRVSEQELSGADSQDGEGPQDGVGMQAEGAGRDPASAGLCPPGRTETPTEHPHHPLSERDSNSSHSQAGPKLEPSSEELPRAAVMGYGQGRAWSSPGTREMSMSIAHRVSPDPDPIWVSKLLKKMEKAFLAHLSRVTAELRARWSLQDNGLLDQMVAELERDMGLRLRDSTEREIRKIQSRAGRVAPGPPRGALRGQASLQTEQRRRRLQGLRNLSAFPEQARGWGPLSLTLEEGSSLGAALGTQPDGEAEGDEFCPCEACVRKKVSAMSPKDTPGVSSAPIKKAFDLWQILQKKKGACAEQETEEGAPEKTGAELSQDPSRARIVEAHDGGQELGLGLDPRAGEAGEPEENRGASRGEDPKLVEADGAGCQDREQEGAAGKRGSKVHTSLGSPQEEAEPLVEGVTERDGALCEPHREADTSEAAGGQGDGVDTVEAQEAGGEGQPTPEGGSQGEKEGGSEAGPGQSQKGESSEISSTDQEGRPLLSSAPGRDTPHASPGPQMQGEACRSSSVSSLGNCSQVSQKGSEEERSSGALQGTTAEEVSRAERKVSRMYPESSTSDQEGVLSGPRTPAQGVGEGRDLRGVKAARSCACAQACGGAEDFSQEDLDF